MNRRNRKVVFDDATGPYGFLSNHFDSTFYEEGISWPSVEHYFQAHKFPGTSYVDTIRTAPTTQKALEYGQSRKHKLRKDWEDVKIDVMRDAMRLKFSQSILFREALKDTGNSKIYFDFPDNFWGTGANGKGDNVMGECLVAIREELKNL